jgi:hypothetical protein
LVLGYLLLILIPLAAIAYLVWDHQRKRAERDAVSAGRLTELFGDVVPAAVQPERAHRSDFSPLAPPAPADVDVPLTELPATRHATVEEAPHAALYAVRERVLTPPQTLVYLLLKTGLPDYVIFARVSLAAILEAGPGLSGFAREEQARRLCALSVDFLVADRSMRPIAAIALDSDEGGSVAQADRESARTRLSAAGVRYIELDPKALPRKDAMRTLVLEGSAAGAQISA